jgi:hypothetical protein
MEQRPPRTGMCAEFRLSSSPVAAWNSALRRRSLLRPGSVRRNPASCPTLFLLFTLACMFTACSIFVFHASPVSSSADGGVRRESAATLAGEQLQRIQHNNKQQEAKLARRTSEANQKHDEYGAFTQHQYDVEEARGAREVYSASSSSSFPLLATNIRADTVTTVTAKIQTAEEETHVHSTSRSTNQMESTTTMTAPTLILELANHTLELMADSDSAGAPSSGRLLLDGNMPVTPEQQHELSTTFVDFIAATLQIERTRLTNVKMQPGSIVITFDLLPDQAATQTCDLASELQTQLSSPTSPLVSSISTFATLDTTKSGGSAACSIFRLHTMCDICPPGTIADREGSTACVECPPGQFSSSDGKSCLGCPDGMYLAHPTDLQCTPCPPGSYTFGTVTGHSSCALCDYGYYQGTSNQTSCVACNNGEYANATGSVTCSSCSAGFYSPDDGLPHAKCEPCQAGYFAPSTKSNHCTPCRLGESQQTAGQSSCDLCAEGSAAGSTGSVQCTACQPGFYAGALRQGNLFQCHFQLPAACQLRPLPFRFDRCYYWLVSVRVLRRRRVLFY